MAFVNGLWLAHHRLPHKGHPSARKGTVLKLATVRLVNRLRLSSKWPVRQRCVCLCVAHSVTEAWSHDEGRCGRHIRGVHGSVNGKKNESVAGSKEMH